MGGKEKSSIMKAVSDNYRLLLPSEVAAAAAECQDAWKHPDIPRRQYEIVKPELEKFRRGESVLPFDALIRCVKAIGDIDGASFLEVGASAGYYNEVLSIAGIEVRYTAVDYSTDFEALAHKIYPGIDFKVGDACAMPFTTESFDVVMSAANIMHIPDYSKAIKEACRVAKDYVIFHRTPIVQGPTRHWIKEAYGVPCYEAHFNLEEFIDDVRAFGFDPIYATTIFGNSEFSHRSFVFRRVQVEPYASNKSV